MYSSILHAYTSQKYNAEALVWKTVLKDLSEKLQNPSLRFGE